MLAFAFLVSSVVFVALPPCPTVLNGLVASPLSYARVFGTDFSVDVDRVAPSFFFLLLLGNFLGFIDMMFLGVLSMLVGGGIIGNIKTKLLQNTASLHVMIQSVVFRILTCQAVCHSKHIDNVEGYDLLCTIA